MAPLHDSPARAVAGALCAAAAAILIASCGASHGHSSSDLAAGGEGGASAFAGAALPLAPPRDFTLQERDGRRVSTREYRGRVVVLAFLDTRCGAPCIVIAEQIRGALDELPADVPVLLVSVDPAADTRASIARFLARVSLTGRAIYLARPHSSLAAVWRAYHVLAPARAAAAFERFAPVVLLDRAGRARVEYALETLTPESLERDVRTLSG